MYTNASETIEAIIDFSSHDLQFLCTGNAPNREADRGSLMLKLTKGALAGVPAKRGGPPLHSCLKNGPTFPPPWFVWGKLGSP